MTFFTHVDNFSVIDIYMRTNNVFHIMLCYDLEGAKCNPYKLIWIQFQPGESQRLCCEFIGRSTQWM